MLKKWMTSAFLAVLLGTSPVKAATVAIAGGSTVCSSYGTIDVGATGNVVINNCSTGSGSTTSTNATFTVTAPTSATVNTPITVTVTRTVASGGVAGADTLTLTSTSGGASFSVPTVSFAAAEGTAAVAKTANVTFSSAGSSILSVSGQGTGNTVVASSSVTISSGGTGSCAGITPFEIKNGGASPYPPILQSTTTGLGAVTLNLGSIPDYATGSVAFQVPVLQPDPTKPGYPGWPTSGAWIWQYTQNTLGSLAPLYVAISTCPGDMRGSGTQSGSAEDILCRRAQPDFSSGVAFSNKPDTQYCKLQPGVTYYVNFRTSASGLNNVSFNLQAGTQ